MKEGVKKERMEKRKMEKNENGQKKENRMESFFQFQG